MEKILSIDKKVKIYEVEKYKKRKEYILNLNFEDLSWDLRREYLIYENENRCNKCGNNEWMGFNIAIEVNHIDGNNTNHVKENLECLCPNCHSITKNWRGRNKSNKRLKISNGELLKVLIRNDWNKRKSLIEVGLTPKGGNYKRCGQIKREFDEFGEVITELNLVIDFDKEYFEGIFKRFETYKEMSEFLGISLSTTVRMCERFELKKESKSMCPKKDVLLDDFLTLKNFVSVGRKYGVSDNAVRKWCKKYEILDECKKMKN